MLSDKFLKRFREFMTTENNPRGAYDAAMKGNTMSKFRYVLLPKAAANFTPARAALTLHTTKPAKTRTRSRTPSFNS